MVEFIVSEEGDGGERQQKIIMTNKSMVHCVGGNTCYRIRDGEGVGGRFE